MLLVINSPFAPILTGIILPRGGTGLWRALGSFLLVRLTPGFVILKAGSLVCFFGAHLDCSRAEVGEGRAGDMIQQRDVT